MADKIFINYRRDDVPGDARGVRDGLADKFGKGNVFMDVDNLLAGQRFDVELGRALDKCDILVSVIGSRWMDVLAARMQGGQRDYVREEIAAALKRAIVVIPVRVGREGQMPVLPEGSALPEDIRDLVQYQRHDVTHEKFGRDIADLAQSIRKVRHGQRTRLPAGALAAIALVCLAVGWVGARAAGIPVWWPFATAGDQAEVARARKAEIAAEAKAAVEAAESRRAAVADQKLREANAIKLPPSVEKSAIPGAKSKGAPVANPPNTDLPVSLGLTEGEAELLLGAAGKTEPYGAGSGGSVLRVEAKGLMLFFEKDTHILSNIRVDKPFGGQVAGMRIGDTLAKLKAAYGEPATAPWDFGGDKAHLYKIAGTTVRFDITPEQKIGTIFVLR